MGIATLLIFIWGINYLKGKDLLQRQQRFLVVYPYVDGLIVSHPVSVNGVKIGQVNTIRFHPDRSGQVLVECIIGDYIDIPVNTIARLSAASLIGGYEIVLQLGSSQQVISTGDTLVGTIQPPFQDEIIARLDPFSNQASIILVRLDTLLGSLNQVFGEINRSAIATNLEVLNNSLKHIESVAYNIRSQEATINQIISKLSIVTDTLAALQMQKTLEQAGASLEAFNQVMQSVNDGQGSMSRLLHDDSLFENLERSSRELELLLEDIRNNPKRYFSFSVFGK